MDSEIERPRHDHDSECEDAAAPTAADAAVQQVPVEPNNLLKLPAERKRRRPADLLRQSAITALGEATRNIARVKNIALQPGLDERLAAAAVDTLDAATLCRLMRAEPDATIRAAAVINRLLDISAASQFINRLWGMEGFENPDPAQVLAEAEAWVRSIVIANDIGDNRYRWPDPYSLALFSYWARFSDRISVPLSGDQPRRVSYYVDRAGIGRMPGFRKEEGPMPVLARCRALPHRLDAVKPNGKQVLDVAGNSVLTRYWHDGKLHRDPLAGPAWHRKGPEGERAEYIVQGRLHRDYIDGPAVIDSNLEGLELTAEEYFEDGAPHRSSHVGPAQLHTNRAGIRVCEVYAEHGKMHRDDAQGPALTRRDESTGHVVHEEYRREGELHRDGGPAAIIRCPDGSLNIELWYQNGHYHRDPAEGPALIYWNEDGTVITATEYWQHGELIEERDAIQPTNRSARRAMKSGKRKSGDQKKKAHHA